MAINITRNGHDTYFRCIAYPNKRVRIVLFLISIGFGLATQDTSGEPTFAHWPLSSGTKDNKINQIILNGLSFKRLDELMMRRNYVRFKEENPDMEDDIARKKVQHQQLTFKALEKADCLPRFHILEKSDSVRETLLSQITFLPLEAYLALEAYIPPSLLTTNKPSRQTECEYRCVSNDDELVTTKARLLLTFHPACHLSAQTLLSLKNEITLLFVNRKYISSGAYIPKVQTEAARRDHVVDIEVVEGKLVGVDFIYQQDDDKSPEKCRNQPVSHSYVGRHLCTTETVNLENLLEKFRILQQDSKRLDTLQGHISSTDTLGESKLNVVRLTEADSSELEFRANNYRSPSVGSQRGEMLYSNYNLWNKAHEINARFSLRWPPDIQEIKDDYALSYSMPFRAPFASYDTRVGASWNTTDSEIISRPFEELDITSKSQTYGISLNQPFFKSYPSSKDFAREPIKIEPLCLIGHYAIAPLLRKSTKHLQDTADQTLMPYEECSFNITLEHKESEMFLRGYPFSFLRGAVDGKMEYTVLRFSHDYFYRGRYNVFAAQSLFNIGIPGWDEKLSIENNVSHPFSNPRFVSWLGQAHWLGYFSQWKLLRDNPRLRRIPPLWGSRFLFKIGGQYANDELLPQEKLSIGGHGSIRGYRENTAAYDQGFFASIEWQLPLQGYLPVGGNDASLFVVPFIDYGTGWEKNDNVYPAPPKDLWSAGLGVRWRDNSCFTITQLECGLTVEWAGQLHDLEVSHPTHELQDRGWHLQFLLKWKWGGNHDNT